MASAGGGGGTRRLPQRRGSSTFLPPASVSPGGVDVLVTPAGLSAGVGGGRVGAPGTLRPWAAGSRHGGAGGIHGSGLTSSSFSGMR